MSLAKPHIALISGAWHSPVHYQEMNNLLEKAGYPVSSIRLPSVGSSEPEKESVNGDAIAIREKLLLPLLDEGKDVVMLMHSYGGCPGSAAAKGLSKAERKTSGGVIGLIYIAAFLAREGDSLLSALGGKFDPWVIINEETGQLDVRDPTEVFYHDVSSDKASTAVKDLKIHSRAALSSPSPPSAWGTSEYNCRRGYIRTLDDHTILPIAQEMMLKHSGVDWNIREMNTSHSPFLSKPQETADIIVEMISGLGTE
ncbi:hypothetical protein AJ78_05733 [Emergomyces pasteurianus Ep9510]|uniref:AB hydrolase-1 domain-containing protein n=1 Tax=Emergomyces pasteurianus Ep9510 TaxID=1447872 RepID=A0A1J9PCU3_9EURO|nr:hypothetical protein AJ78_05733 [Emergomyces pasteurianus Ep9510]